MQALLDRLGRAGARLRRDPRRRHEGKVDGGAHDRGAAARGGRALRRPTRRRTSRGWCERLETDAAGFERAVARVRDAAEAVGATQFEILTAAALLDFAEREVEVAVLEAGLGGRLDATNVVDAGSCC